MASSEELELARARAKAKLRLRKQRTDTPPEPEERPSRLESAAKGAQQGLTFGFADELRGGFGNLLDRVTGLGQEQAEMLGEDFDPSHGYRSLRDAERASVEAAREANPGAFFAGEVAGGMLIPGGASGGLGRAAGRAALEGAAYGAGAAEELEDVGMASVLGAGAGAGFTAGLRGVGKVGETIAKRRIADDLVDEAGNQMPLNIADPEGRIGDLYRNLIGRSIGGRQRLAAQERPFVDKAVGAIDDARTRKSDLAEEIASRRLRPLQEVVETEQQAFYDQAVKAIPDNAPTRLLDRAYFQTAKPSALMKSMNEYWKKDAFKQVKKMSFEVDDDLVAILRREFPDDDIAETMRGKVSGDDLLNLRNRYAMKGNKPTAQGEAAMSAGKARQYSNTIGNWMKQKMGPDEAARFDDELAAYGDWKALQKAKKRSDKGRFNVRALGKADQSDKRLMDKGYGQAIGEAAEQRVTQLQAAQKAADRQAQRSVQKGLDEARAAGAELNKLLTARNPSGLSEALSTRMLSPDAGQLGPLGQLVLGTGVGTMMAQPKVQRAIAGQTGWQQAMRNLSEDERAKLLAEIIRRGGTIQAAQAPTE